MEFMKKVILSRFIFSVSNWRGIVVTVLPFALSPIIIFPEGISYKYFYVIALMVGYWICDALPLPIISLIPTVLFPAFKILESNKISPCYTNEAIVQFMCSMILSLAIEHSILHKRVSLYLILFGRCNIRLLSFLFAVISTLISMFMANVSAMVIMYPIIDSTLTYLEIYGKIIYFHHKPLDDRVEPEPEEITTTENLVQHLQEIVPENMQNKEAMQTEQVEVLEVDDPGEILTIVEKPLPSRETMGFYLICSNCATIGGINCIGTDFVNDNFRAVFTEPSQKNIRALTNLDWALLNIPIIIPTVLLTWFWLQFQFFGLFRKNSKVARRIRPDKDRDFALKQSIYDELHDLGRFRFHEKAVAFCFFIALLLWFFRNPSFMDGWAKKLTNLEIENSTCSVLVVLLLTIIPTKPDFLYMFSRLARKRPKRPAESLITWAIIKKRMPWGLIILLGGGAAVIKASTTSEIGSRLSAHLEKNYERYPKFLNMLLFSLLASYMTEIGGRKRILDLLLPIAARVCLNVNLRWHPFFLMIPITISCTHAFSLALTSATNAVAQFYGGIPSWEMFTAGVVVSIIAILVMMAIFPLVGGLMFEVNRTFF